MITIDTLSLQLHDTLSCPARASVLFHCRRKINTPGGSCVRWPRRTIHFPECSIAMISKLWHDSWSMLKETPQERQVQLALAFGTGGLALCAWVIWRRRRDGQLPPSPRGWPFLGNRLELTEDLSVVLPRMQKEHNLPDIFTVNLGFGTKFIALNSYDVIKEAFVGNGDLFSGRCPTLVTVEAQSIKDEILFKSITDPHFKERKSFYLSTLRSVGFGAMSTSEINILEQVDVVLAIIRPLVEKGQAIEFSEILQNATCNVMFKILFGKSFDYDNVEYQKRRGTIVEWFQTWLSIFPIEFYPRFWAYLTGGSSLRRLAKLCDGVRQIVQEEIETHLKTMDPENPRDFLDAYLHKMGSSLDKRLLTDTILSLLTDSVHSVSSYIKWILTYIISYPDVMAKLHKELDDVTGGNRTVTLSDRAKLPYTEAVIMEVIRHGSPGNLISFHCAVKDCYFRGYFIPKDVHIIANIRPVMSDPTHFANPENFYPERFLDKEGKLMRNEAWIAFGIGSRKCLGEQLTKSELFLFITNLFVNYDFAFTDDYQGISPGTKVVADPPPYKVLLKPRN